MLILPYIPFPTVHRPPPQSQSLSQSQSQSPNTKPKTSPYTISITRAAEIVGRFYLHIHEIY